MAHNAEGQLDFFIEELLCVLLEVALVCRL
jgi:hypothetical protein